MKIILLSIFTFISTASWSDSPSLQNKYHLDGVLTQKIGPAPEFLEHDSKNFPDSGFTELLAFITPSPDQEDAGSCLYMATTGIVEWWLAKLNPNVSIQLEGPFDLSERYTMNLAGQDSSSEVVKDWRTDTILAYNITRKAVKNSHFRYTKGFYKENAEGDLVRADEGEQGAEYGPYFNWIDELKEAQSGFVSLPKFKRTILFADPEHNQWNTDVAPADIVERMKNALTKNKAPLMVIYNHYGYWHAVMVLGFDDQAKTDCKFTVEYPDYMVAESEEILREANNENDLSKKEALIKRAEKYKKYALKAKNRLEKEGGCKGQGVFYVRDSIYPDGNGPVYDYDLSRKGEEGPYVKKVILREYEWAKVLGNHFIQVHL